MTRYVQIDTAGSDMILGTPESFTDFLDQRPKEGTVYLDEGRVLITEANLVALKAFV